MALADGVYAFPQSFEREESVTEIVPSAVATPKGVILIDVGFPGQTDTIESHLADAGYGWDDVSAVLITHHDGDHAGGLAEVVERTDAVVYAHPKCAPYVDGREDTIKSPAGERYPPVPVDVEVVDGVSFRTGAGPMDVVFTPGHTPGHLSLHFPEAGLVIAADAVVAQDGELVGPSEEFTLEMDEALSSLDRLAEREFDRILCFHGGLVEADGERLAAVVEGLR